MVTTGQTAGHDMKKWYLLTALILSLTVLIAARIQSYHMMIIGQEQAAAGGGGTFLLDTFSVDTSNPCDTDLVPETPGSGNYAGDVVKYRCNTAGSITVREGDADSWVAYHATSPGADADYYVEGQYDQASGWVGVAGRFVVTGGEYRGYLAYYDVGGNVVLRVCLDGDNAVNGDECSVACGGAISGTITDFNAATDYMIRLTMTGTTIQVDVWDNAEAFDNNVFTDSCTDAQEASANYAGFFQSNFGSPLDKIEAVD